jgi:hypothetical protein
VQVASDIQHAHFHRNFQVNVTFLVHSRAMVSQSTSGKSSKYDATMLLPQAIPPVNPTSLVIASYLSQAANASSIRLTRYQVLIEVAERALRTATCAAQEDFATSILSSML